MTKTLTKTLRIKSQPEYNAVERGLCNYIKVASDQIQILKQYDAKYSGSSDVAIEDYMERIKAAKSLLKQLRDY